MELEDTAALDEEQQAEADFAAGAGIEPEKPPPAPKPEAKPEPEAKAEPEPLPAPEPEYIQLTREQFANLDAAARKTLSMESQLSKAFGTLGNLQKLVNDLKEARAHGAAVEIPADAFAELEKDFPEIATHTRAALEKTLRGLTAPAAAASAEFDPDKAREIVAKLRTEAEIESLEDEYPDWRDIVGAVDTTAGQQADPDNKFRKWLATKDNAYQARINGTNSAAVLARAIRRFETETKAPAPAEKPKPPEVQQRQQRLRAAVQPRGDGGPAPSAPSEDDEFEAGFRDR